MRWGEVFSKKLGKIKLDFKNPGSGFGGPDLPRLHPTVSYIIVDNGTVALKAVGYTSPPASPEIFPIKIADLPQK